ncbi:hypothetical protein [Aurantimonas sp. 22II-16-19i]|uniref:hypothetical protein n=1 Tax=Aurantimonas sp. 22II-16-19i TaxID=1317114 RepID=UPI00111C6F32|nr:hypothetical protein [Aurantimonas sp. 22II-16-19i]
MAAGVLVALVAGFMAWLAGFGILAGAFDARFDVGSAQLFSPAGIASVVGAVLALAAGGFTAARLAGARRLREASFCGLLTFSTALVVAVVVMTQDPPALVAHGVGPVGSAVTALGSRTTDGMEQGSGEPLAALRAEIRGFLAGGAAANAPEGEADATAAAAAATVLAGVSEMADGEAEARAVEAIVAASGVIRSVAERLLTQWQIANDRAVRGERRATARISGEVAGACLAAFAALLAAMAAAVFGGMLGRVDDSALEIGVA